MRRCFSIWGSGCLSSGEGVSSFPLMCACSLTRGTGEPRSCWLEWLYCANGCSALPAPPRGISTRDGCIESTGEREIIRCCECIFLNLRISSPSRSSRFLLLPSLLLFTALLRLSRPPTHELLFPLEIFPAISLRFLFIFSACICFLAPENPAGLRPHRSAKNERPWRFRDPQTEHRAHNGEGRPLFLPPSQPPSLHGIVQR